MSLETAASDILQRAVFFEQKERFTQALTCYQEGIQLLVNFLKCDISFEKKGKIRASIETYMERAETLKRYISEQKAAGSFHEQLHIENNSTGHGFKTLFGRFLDETVTSVLLEDPYIRSYHQCQNFLMFCELLVKSCDNLMDIKLVTSLDANDKINNGQLLWFRQLATNLATRRITLQVEYSGTLHDRQIKLSSGWIIKMGRGLDIYKPTENKFCLGMHDYDFRQCHETQIDIFHSKDVKIIN